MMVTVGGAALATDARSRAPTRANANNEIFLQFILKILLIFFRPGLRAKSCGSEICPARGFLFLLVVVSVWLTAFGGHSALTPSLSANQPANRAWGPKQNERE